MQSIVRKHLGIEEIISRIMDKVGDIEKIILLGDYARGIDSGLIEVLIVGKKIDREYLDVIRPKIENIIKRKINFLTTTTGTFQDGLVVFES